MYLKLRGWYGFLNDILNVPPMEQGSWITWIKKQDCKNNGQWQEKGYQNRNHERQQQPQQRYRDNQNVIPQEHNGQYIIKKGAPLLSRFPNPPLVMDKYMNNRMFPNHPFQHPRPIDPRINSVANARFMHQGMIPMPIPTPSTMHSRQGSFNQSPNQNQEKDQLDDPAIVSCKLQQSGPSSVPFPFHRPSLPLTLSDLRPRFHTPHPFQYPHIYNKIESKNNASLQPQPQTPKLFQSPSYTNSGSGTEQIKAPHQISNRSSSQDPRLVTVSAHPPPGFPSKNIVGMSASKQWPPPFDNLNLQHGNSLQSLPSSSHVNNSEQISLTMPPSSQPQTPPTWLPPPPGIPPIHQIDYQQNLESTKLS
ncbi:hypothetical protein GQR58_017047 [Nymphon striatum]|nr:hypothetical protein GQR58_017047 [Nymphon striatum]